MSNNNKIVKLRSENKNLYKLLHVCLFIISKQTDKTSKITDKRKINFSLFNELFISVGILMVGWGLPEMINGKIYASWLIGFGFLLVVARIVFDERIRAVISKWRKKYSIPFLIFIVCISFFIPFKVSQIYTQTRIELLSESEICYANKLMPGNEGIPSDDERIINEFVNDRYIVMLGDHSAIFMNEFGTFKLCNNNKPFITLTIDSEGGLLLTTQVMNNTGNEIVKIENNVFKAVPAYAFNPQNPDSQNLIVRDSKKVEVLTIKYLNPKVLRITGRFYLEGTEPVIISSEKVQITGSTFQHLYIDAEEVNIENEGIQVTR